MLSQGCPRPGSTERNLVLQWLGIVMVKALWHGALGWG